MEIIGLHDNGLYECGSKCLIIIKDRILGVYKTNTNPHVQLNQPKDEKKWKFNRIYWKESKPVTLTVHNEFHAEIKERYTHKIEYKTKAGTIQRIFINPTAEERIEIESQLNTWWSGRNKKFNTVLFFTILAALFALLISIFT